MFCIFYSLYPKLLIEILTILLSPSPSSHYQSKLGGVPLRCNIISPKTHVGNTPTYLRWWLQMHWYGIGIKPSPAAMLIRCDYNINWITLDTMDIAFQAWNKQCSIKAGRSVTRKLLCYFRSSSSNHNDNTLSMTFLVLKPEYSGELGQHLGYWRFFCR